uniref:Acetyl-CoA carboxylase subunit n=1 Tax=Pilostyles aethiopica TaxID=301899 RepID=A0A0U3A9T5_9ROSI|nr:acetyl-CoA carboxylase subunit [Pilostyles aethiopica]ALT22438.1 acetyl-CoA carboxylase subunit [Pilostyles aethiopica]
MSIKGTLEFDEIINEKAQTPDIFLFSESIDSIYNESFIEEELKIMSFEHAVKEGELERKCFIDSIKRYQKNTGLVDSVQTGICKIKGITVAIAVMEPQFIRGSMGVVVGEKISNLIVYADRYNLPLLTFSGSGGARVQEGIYALLQMSKICLHLRDCRIKNSRFLHISFIATPTTGGVLASFTMLGDIILSEPDVYVGFAGKELIEEIIKVEVDPYIQSSENFYDKGLVDLILPRIYQREVIHSILLLHS